MVVNTSIRGKTIIKAGWIVLQNLSSQGEAIGKPAKIMNS